MRVVQHKPKTLLGMTVVLSMHEVSNQREIGGLTTNNQEREQEDKKTHTLAQGEKLYYQNVHPT